MSLSASQWVHLQSFLGLKKQGETERPPVEGEGGGQGQGGGEKGAPPQPPAVTIRVDAPPISKV